MFRLHLLPTAALFVLYGAVYGVYEDLHYATADDSGIFTCPDFGFNCSRPGACARDTLIGKYYCCDSGPGAVCWGDSTECGGAEEGQPAGGQIGCTGGFCCRDGREECTQRENQINICWATPEANTNPMANITEEESLELFSSLSSADPSATAFAIDLNAILSTSTPASSSASGTPGASVSRSASGAFTSGAASGPTSTPSPSSDSDSGLSGGAIGGIVVGAIAGIAIIAAGAFLIMRRKKKKNGSYGSTELDSNPHNGNGYSDISPGLVQEKYAHNAAHEAHMSAAPAFPPQELDANNFGPSELPASDPKNAPQSRR